MFQGYVGRFGGLKRASKLDIQRTPPRASRAPSQEEEEASTRGSFIQRTREDAHYSEDTRRTRWTRKSYLSTASERVCEFAKKYWCLLKNISVYWYYIKQPLHPCVSFFAVCNRPVEVLPASPGLNICLFFKTRRLTL